MGADLNPRHTIDEKKREDFSTKHGTLEEIEDQEQQAHCKRLLPWRQVKIYGRGSREPDAMCGAENNAHRVEMYGEGEKETMRRDDCHSVKLRDSTRPRAHILL